MPITIAEVARAAGVSKTTVSLVLNGRHRSARISEATRESVAESALRRGYQPNYAAWSLRRRRSNVVTLLVWRLGSAYFIELAEGVRLATQRRGYDVNVVDAGPVDAEVRALQQVRMGASNRVIVATGYHTTRGPALESVRALAEHGAPLVMLLDHSPDPRIPSIRIDDEHGAYLATRHLIGLGHRHIAHIRRHTRGRHGGVHGRLECDCRARASGPRAGRKPRARVSPELLPAGYPRLRALARPG